MATARSPRRGGDPPASRQPHRCRDIAGPPGNRSGGTPLGEVEEEFAAFLGQGDTLLIGGQVVRCEALREMTAEVTRSPGRDPRRGGGVQRHQIRDLAPFDRLDIADLAARRRPDLPALRDGLDAWLAGNAVMRRNFRASAIVAGLIERSHQGRRKSGRQVTFSSDILYDTLRRHDPGHLLSQITRQAAQRLMQAAGLA